MYQCWEVALQVPIVVTGQNLGKASATPNEPIELEHCAANGELDRSFTHAPTLVTRVEDHRSKPVSGEIAIDRLPLEDIHHDFEPT